jgi:3-dehydroquinate dehydratase/shikimate dehydrogenase
MRTPKLCVTVAAPTMAELRERRDRVTDADLVELRVDSVRDPSAAAALADRRLPVIFTCRPTWEGGWFAGSEEERKRLLVEAQTLGAEYLDVEWRAGFDDVIAGRGGKGVVLSTHDYDGVAGDLESRARAMRATGAEVVKLAVMPKGLADNLALLPLTKDSAAATVVIGMGEAGLPTRILAGRFGSAWTYTGDRIAPGQIPASEMCGQYSFRSLGEGTAVYGVVGRPVSHSISPAIHNAAFRATRLDAVYLPLAATDFEDFRRFADALPIAGASVTAPFKVDAFQAASDLDAVSRRVHAVNTLKRNGARWSACNTDVAGFLAPLEAKAPVRGMRAIVLGAGGAARAVGIALASAGASVTFAARRSEQATDVATMTGGAVTSWPPEPGSWDVLVNTTPVGTAPRVDETPMPRELLTGRLVYDLVYNPIETRLLREAGAAGCGTLGGLDMLIAQAQKQFEWWTGVHAPERAMRDAALKALGLASAAAVTSAGSGL